MEQQLVIFQLCGETYGVDIKNVHEIIRLQPVTEVPRTADFVEGVINLRGRIVPVIDLHKRLGLPGTEETAQSRIMVVEVGGMTVGMIVDAVHEVLRLPDKDIEPPPPMVGLVSVDIAFLRGVGKLRDKLIILLDMDRILRVEEQAELATGQWGDATAAIS